MSRAAPSHAVQGFSIQEDILIQGGLCATYTDAGKEESGHRVLRLVSYSPRCMPLGLAPTSSPMTARNCLSLKSDCDAILSTPGGAVAGSEFARVQQADVCLQPALKVFWWRREAWAWWENKRAQCHSVTLPHYGKLQWTRLPLSASSTKTRQSEIPDRAAALTRQKHSNLYGGV